MKIENVVRTFIRFELIFSPRPSTCTSLESATGGDLLLTTVLFKDALELLGGLALG
jgi:hypothetical protein